jgi:protein involved in polysaccharide export with SLBB domain
MSHSIHRIHGIRDLLIRVIGKPILTVAVLLLLSATPIVAQVMEDNASTTPGQDQGQAQTGGAPADSDALLGGANAGRAEVDEQQDLRDGSLGDGEDEGRDRQLKSDAGNNTGSNTGSNARSSTGINAGSNTGISAGNNTGSNPKNNPRSDVLKPAARDDDAESKLVQRPNPYPTLPSLKELYAQFPSSEVKLKRFGSEAFRNDRGNSNETPLDLPAGADFVLEPGDELILNLWGSLSRRLNCTVDRQGQMALPESGTIMVAGKSIGESQELIQRVLRGQFQDVHVELSLARIHSIRVYVVGDVQRRGAYDISALSTSLNALYAAGGATNRGSMRRVRQYRGQQLVREIDLYDLLLHGVHGEKERLLSGDTILVPPAGPQIAIGGMVRRPAIYELKDEQGLNEALNLAGGVLVAGDLHQINIERTEAHERHIMLSLQASGEVTNGGEGQASDVSNAAFHLQDGDRILVLPILPRNEKAIYLQGHAYRPGRYPYREGMTVADLLQSYDALLPEAADHAEIISLRAPDLRPSTTSFSLAEVLSGGNRIPLKPFDVVRVYGRYEVDAPQVFIRGEVQRPGTYPLSQGMTLDGLIEMAGGFKRSAYRKKIDLGSYVVENGQKVLIRHQTVSLEDCAAAGQGPGVMLKPGDVVSVLQLAGWKDIGAAVTVDGEVMNSGTYAIEEGERLSSVLKRAGGFPANAYPQGAKLERVQVRELAEKNRMEMIHRIETSTPSVKVGLQSAQEQAGLMQSIHAQQEQVLASLRSHPASGRLVIDISSDIDRWENTAADIEMRAGDKLYIPKRPDFVLVTGQVYNATAIQFSPGRNAEWYLRRAGGVSQSGNKKAIFVMRADGSVASNRGRGFGGRALSLRLQPGDSVVVPEKIVGGSQFWKNFMSTAQIMSSAAITGAAIGAF